MKSYIRKSSYPISSDIVSKAHEIYKLRGGEYGWIVPSNNKYGKSVMDEEMFNEILFELTPESFGEVVEISDYWKYSSR